MTAAFLPEQERVSWVHSFDCKAFAILLHAHNREHIAQVHRILTEQTEDMRKAPSYSHGT